MDNKEAFEHKVSEALTEGDMNAAQPESEAPRRLSPRYEIRQSTELDPIVEETRKIRSMAKEVDDRYDEYISRAKGGKDE
jgi:hypothetical protein